MHVHVYCERGEAKFWLEPTIELAQNSGMTGRQIRVTKTLSPHYSREFVTKPPRRQARRARGAAREGGILTVC